MALKEIWKKNVEREAKKTALCVAEQGFCYIQKGDREIRVDQDTNECLANKYGIIYQEDDQEGVLYFYKGTDYAEAEKRRVESWAIELVRDVITDGYVVAKPVKRSQFTDKVNAMLESRFHISRCAYDEEYDIYFLSSSNPEKIRKKVKAVMQDTKNEILQMILQLKGSEKGEDRLLMKILEMMSSETR